MEVIIQLELEAANVLQSHTLLKSDLAILRNVLEKMEATIRPQHLGIDDNELSTFFVVSSIDERARDCLNELRNIEYVTAVYYKPEPELP